MEKQSTYTNFYNNNQHKSKRKRLAGSFLLLLFLLLLFFVVNICVGSVVISPENLWNILWRRCADEVFTTIVYHIRMPRALAAILLGGALALSGYLLQTFFQNPIAGPFVLGISSGAKLVVAFTMILFLNQVTMISSLTLIVAAFMGAMLSMGVVLIVSRRVHHMSVLILVGVMIGYICSAITDFVVAFADDTKIVNLHNWSMGSFSGISWNHIPTIFIVVLITFTVVFLLSKPMNAYQLGETYAGNTGVNIRQFRTLLVILSSILSACVTAFAGPVSFVGIAVPQMMKRLFGTAKPMIMIPACFLGGAVFCLLSDLIARMVFAPTELSISTVTAIFGAPVVIYVIVSNRTQQRRNR